MTDRLDLRRALVVAAVILAIASALLLQARRDTREEIAALTVASDSAQVAAGDARLQQEVDRIRLDLERARVRATTKTEPHLALAITDGQLSLERGDIVLRTIPVEASVPRGVRTIASVGANGIVLSDSIRMRPAASPADTSPPEPGIVRLRAADFAAILPNVKPGLTVYVF